MTASRYLIFDDLNAPVALHSCPELEGMIRQALPGWPFVPRDTAPDAPPCMTVTSTGDGRYEATRAETRETRRLDAVNTICDMVVELSWEALRTDPGLLCMHAAGVAFAGRLVAFPNRRRAGKSLLSACLAHAGNRVFTDDILPLRIDTEGRIRGLANGVAPRLRLPLPETLSPALAGWIGGVPGPQNAQYKYLRLPSLPPRGEALPLGAVVILDRDGTRAPRLEPVPPADALEVLLHQNFGRMAHAAVILRAFETLTAELPLYRLAYDAPEPAAALLQERFAARDSPVARSATLRALGQRLADLGTQTAPPPAFDPALRYVRAPGLTETTLNGRHYVADAQGVGIHGLNDGALAIWRLLEEPIALAEAVDILATAFPDAGAERIAEDTRRTLAFLVEQRLAVPG